MVFRKVISQAKWDRTWASNVAAAKTKKMQKIIYFNQIWFKYDLLLSSPKDILIVLRDLISDFLYFLHFLDVPLISIPFSLVFFTHHFKSFGIPARGGDPIFGRIHISFIWKLVSQSITSFIKLFQIIILKIILINNNWLLFIFNNLKIMKNNKLLFL